MTEPWPAPRASGPVDAVVALPGSKSVTNRALVIAALADGTSTVRGPLRSRDTELMAAALRALGADVEDDGDDWRVTGSAAEPSYGDRGVDVGLAGTVARFTPPVAVLGHARVGFDGDPRMRERPMGAVVDALRSLGVPVDATRGGLPFTVHGTGGRVAPTVTVDGSTTSQVVSGLLLAAPRFADGLHLRHAGGTLPSRPHVELTVAMMRSAGAGIVVGDDEWRVSRGSYRAGDLSVEPDLSGAAAFLAAAIVTGGRVRFPAWPRHSVQPGTRLVQLATAMGASCSIDGDGLTVVGPEHVDGVDADLSDCGELAPVLAAAAATARTPSRLSGIAHVRGHETDRLRALTAELNRAGGQCRETPDGLVIEPAPTGLHAATLNAHDDHRLAMAFAVLGLVVDGIAVDDIAATSKTMPDFPRRWAAMLDGALA